MDLWHALNRGVGKQDIFLDTQDYARFVHNMYEFNDASPAQQFSRRNVGPSRSNIREQIVNIHGWCLMKNHYHLLLSDITEGGVGKFLMKLNVGYAKYFNEKYKKGGYVFGGRTKKVLIEREQQFNYILHYIHLNPLDYLKTAKNWRIRNKSTIKNYSNALEYLKKYRWSSYLDYIGEENFPSIVTTTLFSGDTTATYEQKISKYLKDAESDSKISSALLLE